MKLNPMKFLTIAITAALLASCGGDDNKKSTNKVNTSTGGSADGVLSGNSNQSIPTSSLDADIRKIATDLAGSLNCPYGKRLTNVQQYSIQSGVNTDHNRICGQFQQGTIAGQAGQHYVGVSAYNDFMIVSEIVNGNQVVGHNVYISMCAQYLNNYGTQIPLIDDARPLSGFQAPYCLYLDKDNFCPHGVVDAAQNTYMISGQHTYNVNGQQAQLQPFEVWTTFFKPTCNGRF